MQFNYPILANYFQRKIGFRQTLDPCVPKLHPDLISGLLFVPDVKNCGSLLTPEFIDSAINELNSSYRNRFANWVNTDTYALGDRVRYDDGINTFVYVSRQGGNINNTPAFDSAYWETDLSYYCRNIFDAAIKEKIPQVVALNNIENNLRDTVIYSPLLEERTFPQLLPRFSDDILFCTAIQFDPVRNSKFTITDIGLRVQDAQTIPVYLYHTSQPDPISVTSITVNLAQAGRFNWFKFDTPLELSYYSDINNSAGMWILGIYQSDILGDYYTTRVCFKPQIAEHLSFVASVGQIGDLNKPNIPELGFGYSGISACPDFLFNIRYTFGFDYTYLILDSGDQFLKLLQYEIAYRIISDMNFSSRIGRDKSNIDSKIQQILYGVVMENGKLLNKGLADYVNEFENQIKLNLNYLGKNPFEFQFG